MIKKFFSKYTGVFQHWLASSKLPIVLVGVALALTVLSVGTGLQSDDYFHRRAITTHTKWMSADASLTEMFSFLRGTPTYIRDLIDAGYLPWWTLEEIRIAFFRPLTELTHWLDYQLWPDFPAMMHLHNLVWFGVLIIAITIMYRQFVKPAWVAGLAALLYAIDDAHGMPVGWIANRSTLIATLFGVLTLIVHDRSCRNGWKPGILVGPICFLLGLLSKETALATGAYLVSYQLFLASGTPLRRIAGLIPYVIVGGGWCLSYYHLGFGTWGSGAYIDPVREPLLYLGALVERGPILLFGQWFFPDASTYVRLPKLLGILMWIGASTLIIALALLLIPLLKRDAVARFWAAGMVLALFPVCAMFPDNRLLFFVGLGGMGLLAQFLAVWIRKPAWLPSTRLWRGSAQAAVFLFVVVHGIVAPLTLPASSTSFARLQESLAESVMNLPEEKKIYRKTLVFINPPYPSFIPNAMFMRATHGRNSPGRVRILASGMAPRLNITRVDEHAMEIQSEDGFIASDLDKLHRSSSHPMHVGQRVELSNMTVEILSLTEDQLPLRARFTFDKSLDDSSLLFMAWQDHNFVRFRPPATGKSVQLTRNTFVM